MALSHHSVIGLGSAIFSAVARRTCRMACLATKVTHGAGLAARDCCQLAAVSLPSTKVGMATALPNSSTAGPGGAAIGLVAADLRAPVFRTWMKSWPPKALATGLSPGCSSKERVMTGKRCHLSSLSRLSRWQPMMTRTTRPSGITGAFTVTISPGAA